jgi:hypothetical protein
VVFERPMESGHRTLSGMNVTKERDRSRSIHQLNCHEEARIANEPEVRILTGTMINHDAKMMICHLKPIGNQT